MEMEKLLNRKIACECGQTHFCPIHTVEISAGALTRLAETAKQEGIKRPLLVADDNTYAACGERALGLLEAGGIAAKKLIYHAEGFLIPDERAICQLLEAADETVDGLIAVGSGVINDLCKYVSFKLRLPYLVVATAPSMDGYASVGAAMIIAGMKVTYSSHMPCAIIGDTQVLAGAPKEMILAGYGDMIGKFTALNDWELGHMATGEHYCAFVAGLVRDSLCECIAHAQEIANGEEESIAALTKGLVVTGVAMALIGNSRPASGSEHHLSHYFEVTGIMEGTPYFHHGIDVAYASVLACKAREQLGELLQNGRREPFDRALWESEIRRVYGPAAQGVIRLQSSQPFYDEQRAPARREQIAQRLEQFVATARQTPSAAEMIHLLQDAGLSMQAFYKQYGMAKIRDCVRYAKDLKDRYTVWWLLRDLDLLDAFAEGLAEE